MICTNLIFTYFSNTSTSQITFLRKKNHFYLNAMLMKTECFFYQNYQSDIISAKGQLHKIKQYFFLFWTILLGLKLSKLRLKYIEQPNNF